MVVYHVVCFLDCIFRGLTGNYQSLNIIIEISKNFNTFWISSLSILRNWGLPWSSNSQMIVKFREQSWSSQIHAPEVSLHRSHLTRLLLIMLGVADKWSLVKAILWPPRPSQYHIDWLTQAKFVQFCEFLNSNPIVTRYYAFLTNQIINTVNFELTITSE